MNMAIKQQGGWERQKRKRAVIYNRCSTEKEVQENAIVIQEQESIRACEINGWEIVHIYKELESGRYADIRDEYQQLICDIPFGKFDIIVVKCQDRIMRNPGDWFKFVDLLNEYDIQLYFYMDNKFYDYEEDDMLYGITMQMHAFYSKNLSRKIRQAHLTRQLTLAHPNISEIYGWDKIDKYTYVINENEAKYIRKGYELLREGKGFHTIANTLYEEGARSKKAGKAYKDKKEKRIKYYDDKISSSTWRKILYSTNIYGTVTMNKKVLPYGKRKRITTPKEEWIYFENALPAIVSKEYYEETITMHQSYLTGHRKTIKEYDRSVFVKGMYTWSGRLICDCCGSKYYRMKVKKRSTGETEVKWRCSKVTLHGQYSEENKTGCKNILVEEIRLKELLTLSIEEKFGEKYKNIDSIVEMVLSNIKRVFNENDDGNDLLNIQIEISKKRKKKDVLFDKLMSQLISDADFKKYGDAIDKDICRLTELESELKIKKNTYKDYDGRLEEIRKGLKSNVIKKAGINIIIDTIKEIRICTSGKCVVHFDREKIFRLLNILGDNIVATELDRVIDLEFIYYKPTVYQARRAKVNQQILDTFKENPHLTIQEVADRLDEKYSYIYTSVAKLREQNRM